MLSFQEKIVYIFQFIDKNVKFDTFLELPKYPTKKKRELVCKNLDRHSFIGFELYIYTHTLYT